MKSLKINGLCDLIREGISEDHVVELECTISMLNNSNGNWHDLFSVYHGEIAIKELNNTYLITSLDKKFELHVKRRRGTLDVGKTGIGKPYISIPVKIEKDTVIRIEGPTNIRY